MGNFRSRIVGTGEERLDQILFNPANWRIHPKYQQDNLKNVLETVGFVQNVIVNKTTGNLVDGHMRCQVAAREGEETIPVVYVELSPEEEGIILASLDPIGEMGKVDRQKLDELLQSIQLDDARIKQLMNRISDQYHLKSAIKGSERDPGDLLDKADALQEKWKVHFGDIYQLGSHRIGCMDSTNINSIQALFQGKTADSLVTDPPYGIDYHTGARFKRMQDRVVENDDLQGSRLQEFLVKFLTIAPLSEHNTIYIFFAEQTMLYLLQAAKSAGIYHSQTLVWVKNSMVVNRQDYNYQHEPILYGWKNRHKFYGASNSLSIWNERGDVEDYRKRIHSLSKKQLEEIVEDIFINTSTVIDADRPSRSELHPTTKPLALIEKLVSEGSHRGSIVYDGFLGSGTCLVACETTERICYGIDKVPKYIACALERWSITTGREPSKV